MNNLFVYLYVMFVANALLQVLILSTMSRYSQRPPLQDYGEKGKYKFRGPKIAD